MRDKNICLIYTGGTIGMERTAQGYAPMRHFAMVLSQLLREHSNSLPQYTLRQFEAPIDSTNATPEDWCRIAHDIASCYQQHDAFVVLHGTDTMAYTAAALSFMLRGLRKPVILTGSQIPMLELRSDAPQNLIGAMQLAARDDIHEVAIYFSQRLLRGNRATKLSAQRLDAFDSPNYPKLAEVGIEVAMNSAALLPCPDRECFELPSYACGQVVPLRFVPGLPLQAVQALLDLDPKALILQGHGAGNVPDRDPALREMLRAASERGVVLACGSQAPQASVQLHAYATGSVLDGAKVVGTADMTFEATFAKLHHLFALGLTADEVRLALLRDLSGELTIR
ncbi:asparaginase domain-containing protein [Noviherbaspirillum massiliense]|uniref:asparaginase domain-containing protein n=1 Tax=Noviherbaspirillum massiliense TaxID=1465823 RepID=UPI0002ECA492|nr:asparaginase domain-containing protein [Noviherbaspirillum massiliense]